MIGDVQQALACRRSPPRRRASERRIKALSADGALANARIIHFATHGLPVKETESVSSNIRPNPRRSDVDFVYIELLHIEVACAPFEQFRVTLVLGFAMASRNSP